MAGKKISPIKNTVLDNYSKIISGTENIERKGVTMPYTSCNGHMFSFLMNDGSMALRLPQESREKFIKKYKTTLCVNNGVVLKEYVVVPDRLFKNYEKMNGYFKEGYDYVFSLKPKVVNAKKKRQ